MENASKALVIAGAILISILLITIGIVLVNSGKGVAETGTANMNSQKIQAFNSQFTPYEGKKKGSEIRSLVNLVNASNATDEEHQVTVYLDNALGTSIAGISSTISCTIEIGYATSSTGTSAPATSSGITRPIGPSGSSRKTEAGYIEWILIKK